MVISRLIDFFDRGIWEIRLKHASFFKAGLIRCARILILACRGFVKDGCSNRASVLTYYSVLNVVPLIAVAFAMAKGFGLQGLAESRILEMAAEARWQEGMTEQIIGFSRAILDQARGGVIAGVGVMLLLWTVISISWEDRGLV
jgi:membrane protein